VITLEAVSKSYDRGVTYAVRDVDLTIKEGSLVVLLGESGCGKTTTLKMINRLVELSAGRITVGGEDMAEKTFIASIRCSYGGESATCFKVSGCSRT
jgi:osmoprotectant transport system ATP-binding protein